MACMYCPQCGYTDNGSVWCPQCRDDGDEDGRQGGVIRVKMKMDEKQDEPPEDAA